MPPRSPSPISSEGESEISVGAEATATLAVEPSDYKAADLLDSKSPFPWDKVHFFLPTWLPSSIRAHHVDRIKAFSGIMVYKPTEAHVILSYHGAPEYQTDPHKELAGVKDGSAVIAHPEWLAQVYFSGLALAPTDTVPVFAEEGPTYVAVSDLGDDAQRLRTMVDLELHGAIVVDMDEADICIAPKHHEFLTQKPIRWIDHQFQDVDWVRRKIKAAKYESLSASDVRLAGKEPRRPAIAPSAKTPASQAAIKPQATVPAGSSSRKTKTVSHREPFTSEDRDNLARWLAFTKPGGGRTTRGLYDRLLQYDSKDPVYWWCGRHSPSAWHDHYRRTRHESWSDGVVLEQLVDKYALEGVDDTLRTKEEIREARGKRKEVHEEVAEHRPKRSRPAVPVANLAAERRAARAKAREEAQAV